MDKVWNVELNDLVLKVCFRKDLEHQKDNIEEEEEEFFLPKRIKKQKNSRPSRSLVTRGNSEVKRKLRRLRKASETSDRDHV